MAGDGKFPSETADKFVIRLPDGLRERVKAAAARNNRTMNAEIVTAIEAACPETLTVMRGLFPGHVLVPVDIYEKLTEGRAGAVEVEAQS